MALKVEEWQIDKLIEYARNPRKNDEQVPRMVSAIKEFGFRIPIVAKSDGTVIDGHLRLKAARQLGLKTVPVALADELTDTQVKAFRLLANQSANWAEWDNELLQLELDDLKLADFDTDILGFNEDFLADMENKNVGTVEEDEIPEVEELQEPVSKLGDIWLCGTHRVMCGDSTDGDTVSLLMNGENADISFTSPPYNAGFGKNITENSSRQSKYIEYNDDKTQDDYLAFLQSFYQNARNNSQYCFINIQMLANNKYALFDFIHKNMKNVADIIIWDKTRAQPAVAEQVLNSVFEFVLCFSDKGNRAIGVKPFHGTLQNIIHIAPDGKHEFSNIHNATFPVELPLYFVSNFSNDSCLDLFGGSGSTLIACEQTHRKCFMMELSPQYVDVIVKRWQNLTGKDATLESSGKTFNELAYENKTKD